MPEHCTCGAQLPPDALFCHKCGKPQREIVPSEPVVLEQPTFIPPPMPQQETAAPNFRNPVALRIALLVAIGATLLSFLPYLNWLAAGYFAAFFYRRRTGHLLNIGGGVRMGWITGVLMFVIVSVLFAGVVVLLNSAEGMAAFQAQVRNATDPRVQDMLRILQNRWEVAGLLAQLFVFITCLSMAGGALGAKLAGRH